MIRNATIQDARSIATIHIDAWKLAYRGIVSEAYLKKLDLGVKTQSWETILKEQKSQTFVMESVGEITSWISYGKSRDHNQDRIGEIWALYVCPKFWRHGHGAALIKHVEEIAKKDRKSSLVLWVLDQNKQGRSFYEKVGYIPDGAEKSIEIEQVKLEELRYEKYLE